MEQFRFYTDQVAYKTSTSQDGEKSFFVEGYASTGDLDLVGDIVTAKAMKSMLTQIKGRTIKLDVEHEAWKNSPDTLPIGKIVEAKVDQKGLWIKAEINSHSPSFKAVWNSVKDGFLDAFSIAYTAVKSKLTKVGEKTIRLLDEVHLLNVALTGNPANPNARISHVMAKSIDFSTEQEDQQMEKEIKEEPVAPEAPEEALEDAPKEAPAEPEVEEKSAPTEDSSVVEVKNLKQDVAEMKTLIGNLTDERKEDNKVMAELKERLVKAEEALGKPQIKHIQEEMPVENVEARTPLQMIR